MPRPLGIDLGTTYSLAAYVDERNRPQVVELEGGRPLLASAVHYGRDGAVEVGAAARIRAAERPLDTVLSVKRLMGRGGADLRAEERGLARVDGGAPGPVVKLAVAGGSRVVTPTEVSADILRALARRAAERLGEPPGGCVITVPAYFDDAQRQATKDAARLAGLDVLRLLNEPTAAALAYGLEKRSRGTFAVYDLGGGTFDVSILRLADGVFEVLATGGDTRLGGDDLDAALARHLLRKCGVGEGAGSAGDLPPAALRGVTELARRSRETLSHRDELALDEELPGGRRLRCRLTRAELEQVIAPIVERTSAPCRQALRDAGLGGRTLDGVVLAGGATRTPLVRRHVRRLFGLEPFTDIDPDTVVALGAAIQADALERGGREDALLLDVIPLSLGVEMMGGVVERIVPRNSTIPASATQQFTTHAAGQTGLVVHVVQGERELARDCRSLARFTLRGIPPLPAGAARVEITYAVDADGILAVSARELSTGVEQRIQVKPSYGLSEQDVERMLVESLRCAGEDAVARFLEERRVEAAQLIASLEAALAEDGDLLGEGEREELELRMRGLAEAAAGGDPGALHAWIGSLDEAARAFTERRMDRHVARAVAGRSVEEFGGG